MDIRFAAHNTHLGDPKSFADLDPHLRQIQKQPLIHRSCLLDELPSESSGIFTITGGRQIGKTTLLKQLMQDLLKRKIRPNRVAYFTGELIDDHHSLVRLLTDHLESNISRSLAYVIVDEITYVRDWDKGVKFLADSGLLDKVQLILTGSDSVVIQEARKRLPGRRGKESKVDFHMYPLAFSEVVRLKNRFKNNEMKILRDSRKEPGDQILDRLYEQFDQFLVHGGFLTAINDIERAGEIAPATFHIYSDWIIGDVLKRGKQESYLREVLGAVMKRLGSQTSWTNLAKDLSVDHQMTVANYITLLASMDAVFVQEAIIEDKLVKAPKKAKKICFTDPFIHHAIMNWLKPVKNPYREYARKSVSERVKSAHLAESCAVSHVRRHHPTFYIKADGEVDIAYVSAEQFFPIEIKWSAQIRPKDIKQAAKYSNSIIWSRRPRYGKISGVNIEPLPLGLFRFGDKAR
jgi:uncharacterized protein